MTPTESLIGFLADGGVPLDPSECPVADWDALVNEAERREVDAYLYHRLRGSAVAARIPADALSRLRELYGLNGVVNQKLRGELRAVLEELHARGIDVIVLKGAYLAEHVYAEFGLRTMSDIDLLVKARELPAAHDALQSLGYACAEEYRLDDVFREAHHLPPFMRAGGTPIEVHWTLENPSRLPGLDLDGLWQRSVEAEFAGAPARALSPGDLLFHLCLHEAHHHRWGARRWGSGQQVGLPLRPVLDLALTLQSTPDAELATLPRVSNDAGIGRFVYCALILARDLLHAPIADDTLAALEHDESDDAIVREVKALLLADGMQSPRLLEPWQALAERRSWLDRIRLFALMLFPSRPAMERLYRVRPGSPLVLFFYAVRPMERLVRRGFQAIGIAWSPGGRATLLLGWRRYRVSRWSAGSGSASSQGRETPV